MVELRLLHSPFSILHSSLSILFASLRELKSDAIPCVQ